MHPRSVYRRRRAAVLLGAMAVLAALGVGAYALVAVVAGGGAGSARRIEAGGAPGSATPASTTTTTTTPPVPPEPGGGTTLFPSHRIVAYYGAPDDPTLGVLGEAPPATLWPRVTTAAAPFAQPGVALVPSYELIAVVAQDAPGPGGTYARTLPAAEISSYLSVVQAHGGMLILDIQPGAGDFLTDAQSLAPWLANPDVGLALDPEWQLQPGQQPLQQIGHTDAAAINATSAWLSAFTVAHHLPQKLLLVHQFQIQMVQDKAAVTPQPDLAIAFNMDGFGSTADKEGDYRALAADPRWALGYKLFYSRDTPLQTPAQVLALSPAPSVIEYE